MTRLSIDMPSPTTATVADCHSTHRSLPTCCHSLTGGMYLCPHCRQSSSLIVALEHPVCAPPSQQRVAHPAHTRRAVADQRLDRNDSCGKSVRLFAYSLTCCLSISRWSLMPGKSSKGQSRDCPLNSPSYQWPLQGIGLDLGFGLVGYGGLDRHVPFRCASLYLSPYVGCQCHGLAC